MIEKVSPSNPDKVADRIAGAIVDLAYKQEHDPIISVDVMIILHSLCYVILKSSVEIATDDIISAINRISDERLYVQIITDHPDVGQDADFADSQAQRRRCRDNGIFRGMPMTEEQKKLTQITKQLYETYHTDGIIILDGTRLIISQGKAKIEDLQRMFPAAEINAHRDWICGTDVCTGATNRRLFSDMGFSVTGGGLHGRDLSRGSVSVAIYAWLEAQRTGRPVEMCCAEGDDTVNGIPYKDIVNNARLYIYGIGGFEKLAEFGPLM